MIRMGVLDLLPTSGGSVHYECRRCGTNLRRDRPACPACGGSVAAYEV
ncbi:hypothetical protein [Salinirussus salinus]|nr:hypothetical protein [Salinirussus salinus]